MFNVNHKPVLIVILVYPPGNAGKGKRGELQGIYSETSYSGFCSFHCMQISSNELIKCPTKKTKNNKIKINTFAINSE